MQRVGSRHGTRLCRWIAPAAATALLLATAPGCSGLFLQPDRELRPLPPLQSVTREDVWIRSSDGVQLHGWLFRPRGDPLATIVFFHGNAENISTHVRSVLWLALAGYRILAVDYRGYGRSEGEADLPGIHADALAVLAAAFELDGGAAEPAVVVLGQSLGAAVAVWAVAHSPHRDRVRMVIADSAFTGYRDIAREKLGAACLTWPLQVPLSLLVTDVHSAERWIGELSPIPVLVLHGAADPVVPLEHARRLHARAEEPRGLWVVRGAGHIQALQDPDLRQHLLETLSEMLEADAGGRKGGGGNPEGTH